MEASWRHSGNVFRTVLFLCYGSSEVVLCAFLREKSFLDCVCVALAQISIHTYSYIRIYILPNERRHWGVFFGCQAISEQDDFQFSRDDEETFLLIIFLVLELSIVGGFFILFLLFTNVNGENLIWTWKSSCGWAFFCASRTWLRAVWNFFTKKFKLELF